MSPEPAPVASAPAPEGVDALYFDGRSGQGRPVRLVVQGGQLQATPRDSQASHLGVSYGTSPEAHAPLHWPLSQVRWPESTRHGQRVVHLAPSGQLEVADATAFDAWRRRAGLTESWVVRAQQHWRSSLAALVLLVALVVLGYRWGVPWAADGLVAMVPLQVDQSVGEAALENLRGRWLIPSQLPAARQQALRDLCTAALNAALPAQDRPAWTLHFHAGGKSLGANAFALPGGHIVITDEMVALLEGQDDALVGVIGHEYGHVLHRHGMHALVRFALVSTATSVVLGDFSTVLAGAGALLAQLAYSRDAEREADHVAARVLAGSGGQPAAMLVLFERLTQRPGAATKDGGLYQLPIALASHPADVERVRFFQEYGSAGAR